MKAFVDCFGMELLVQCQLYFWIILIFFFFLLFHLFYYGLESYGLCSKFMFQVYGLSYKI